MQTISLPIPESWVQTIDGLRGDVPRTVWIRRAIEQRIKEVEREYEAQVGKMEKKR